jgi:hypothetical protein
MSRASPVASWNSSTRGVDTIISVSYPAQVGGPEWPKETATVIGFRNGLVVHMQQYRTRDQALRSLA